MIFLAAMPLVFAFMNAAVPLQIGARDVTFRFEFTRILVIFLWWSIFKFKLVLGGAPDAGWTSYASLALASKGHGVDFYVLGLQISGIGTLIGGINFLVTIINMRARNDVYAYADVYMDDICNIFVNIICFSAVNCRIRTFNVRSLIWNKFL